MEARYATRKHQGLAACPGAPARCAQVLPRWTTVRAPFVATFCRPALAPPAHPAMWGWLSEVDRKHIASSA